MTKTRTTMTKTVTVEREGGVVTRTVTTVTCDGEPSSEADFEKWSAEAERALDRQFEGIGEMLAKPFRDMAEGMAAAFKRRK